MNYARVPEKRTFARRCYDQVKPGQYFQLPGDALGNVFLRLKSGGAVDLADGSRPAFMPDRPVIVIGGEVIVTTFLHDGAPIVELPPPPAQPDDAAYCVIDPSYKRVWFKTVAEALHHANYLITKMGTKEKYDDRLVVVRAEKVIEPLAPRMDVRPASRKDFEL